MNKETATEIRSLAAETLALSVVATHVLHRIAQTDPKLADAISLGFAEAASHVENRVDKLGKPAPADYIVEAFRIVEELRTATLGNQTKPKLAFSWVGLNINRSSPNKKTRCCREYPALKVSYEV